MSELTKEMIEARPKPFIGMRVCGTTDRRWLTVKHNLASWSTVLSFWMTYRLPGEPGCPPDPQLEGYVPRVGDEWVMPWFNLDGSIFGWIRYEYQGNQLASCSGCLFTRGGPNDIGAIHSNPNERARSTSPSNAGVHAAKPSKLDLHGTMLQGWGDEIRAALLAEAGCPTFKVGDRVRLKFVDDGHTFLVDAVSEGCVRVTSEQDRTGRFGWASFAECELIPSVAFKVGDVVTYKGGSQIRYHVTEVAVFDGWPMVKLSCSSHVWVAEDRLEMVHPDTTQKIQRPDALDRAALARQNNQRETCAACGGGLEAVQGFASVYRVCRRCER